MGALDGKTLLHVAGGVAEQGDHMGLDIVDKGGQLRTGPSPHHLFGPGPAPPSVMDRDNRDKRKHNPDAEGTTPAQRITARFGLTRGRHFCALLSHTNRSEAHTSELQSLMRHSYDVFCLKKKNTQRTTWTTTQ